MQTSTIMLSSIEAVKKFVTLTNQYDFVINLATDKYKIDAKSIMGVFSLDLSKPVTVEVDTANEGAANFLAEIKQFELAQ
ncbi:MAG TPA: HPr family phosphocarrier protein [Oscillospiraceae bacterium]|nr:HPr family phosphocarrier protein [Oscillospiraceae bacterium]